MYWNPLHEVWINLDIAKFFIDNARHGGTTAMPVTWCLYIAAGALWSAADIFDNEKHRKRLGIEGHEPAGHRERLVSYIRHGAVHYNYSQGIGASVKPGEHVDYFWWLDMAVKPRQVPLSTVIDKLAAERERIREVVRRVTGEEMIPFVP